MESDLGSRSGGGFSAVVTTELESEGKVELSGDQGKREYYRQWV